MTAEILGDRGDPWTEEDYLALEATRDRVELIDGSLIVSPAPTPWHQMISRRLANALEPAAKEAGLWVYEAVNVRLRHGRIPIPDVVIVDRIDPHNPVIDVGSVKMVCEIVSPGNAAGDRVLKMHLYGHDRIPWYLLVEPGSKGVFLQLFRHNRYRYTRHGAGAPGTPLVLSEPISLTLDPAALLPSA